MGIGLPRQDWESEMYSLIDPYSHSLFAGYVLLAPRTKHDMLLVLKDRIASRSIM